MKRLYLFARLGLLLTVIIWVIHMAITLPDVAVRVNGIAMMVLLGLNSFCAIRLRRDGKEA